MHTSPRPFGRIVTKDIFHAAYLISCGHVLRDIQVEEGATRERAVFLLEGPGIADSDARYRSGLVTVNLFVLKEAVKQVKDALFAALRSRA